MLHIQKPAYTEQKMNNVTKELSEVFTSGIKLSLVSNRCAKGTLNVLSFSSCLKHKMP